MSGTIVFTSSHGDIHFDVTDEAAQEFTQSQRDGLTAKGGVVPMGKATEAAKPDTRFESAMSNLKAYAGSLQDLIAELDVRPREVSVEVGLKLKAEAGFFAIATAGTEADMKVKLSWEPKPKGEA